MTLFQSSCTQIDYPRYLMLELAKSWPRSTGSNETRAVRLEIARHRDTEARTFHVSFEEFKTRMLEKLLAEYRSYSHIAPAIRSTLQL